MKKVAVCIPSYNEAINIKNITRKIDAAIYKLSDHFDFVIINSDNNSLDQTSKRFIKTKTKCKKISLISYQQGKGYNVKNFIDYALMYKFDYLIMIDADLKSFKSNWIEKMLLPLLNGYDFVCPLYKRSRYEGNTTNHFIYPIMKVLFGINIRQPIGGDFAFDRRFMTLFKKINLSDNIYKYGIDIFLLLLSIKNNLNIKQVNLGRKLHAPSYLKMKDIFLNVACAFKDSVSILNLSSNYRRNQKNLHEKFFNAILHSSNSHFINKTLNHYTYKKMTFDEAKEKWGESICFYIKHENINYEALSNSFLSYVFAYWNKCRLLSKDKCEEIIEDFIFFIERKLVDVEYCM